MLNSCTTIFSSIHRLKPTRLIGEESEDETIDDIDDDKQINDDQPRSRPTSPLRSMQALSATRLLPQVPVTSAPISPVAPPSSEKKRDRSENSQEAEAAVPSSKKHHSNRLLGLPGVNIKIENRDDGRTGDSTVVVSMDINGTTFQGVLFAQPK